MMIDQYTSQKEKLTKGNPGQNDTVSQRKKIPFAGVFITGFFILFAVFASGWYEAKQQKAADELVVHTDRVVGEIRLVLLALDDAETGQRGFLLTGEDNYLDTYEAAIIETPINVTELRALTTDNPSQQQRIDRLDGLITEKLAELAETIQLRRTEGLEAAMVLVRSDAGKIVMDNIRQVITALIDEELNLRVIRRQEQKDIQQVFLYVEIFGFIAFIGLFGLVYFRVRPLLISQIIGQEQLKSGAEFQQVISETMADGLVVMDPYGTVITVNQAIVDMFGYSADEMVGNNIKMLMQGDTRRDHDGYLKNFRETGKASIVGVGPRDVQGFSKDGDLLELELAVNTSMLDGREIYVGSLRDLTEKKRILEESNAELEKFAYVASHDLRAPLRAIDNLVQWIEEDIKDVIEGDTKKNMALLRGRVSRLEALLDDILAYSRAGRLTDKTVRVDVAFVVQDVTAILDVPKGFKIKTKGQMPNVLAPKGALNQIFNNLMTNALKHHDKKTGTITVSVVEKGDFWEFGIIDDGPGIPHQFHEKIFGMFQKLEGRDKAEGSGMGLAIIKKLVTTQGGKIRVDSSSEKRGTTFYFTWPMMNADEME